MSNAHSNLVKDLSFGDIQRCVTSTDFKLTVRQLLAVIHNCVELDVLVHAVMNAALLDVLTGHL